ncbi:hypothetical protein Tco_0065758 [Tanacetum coccineum]
MKSSSSPPWAGGGEGCGGRFRLWDSGGPAGGFWAVGFVRVSAAGLGCLEGCLTAMGVFGLRDAYLSVILHHQSELDAYLSIVLQHQDPVVVYKYSMLEGVPWWGHGLVGTRPSGDIRFAEELNDEYIDNEADDEYDHLDSFINDGPIVDEPTEDDVSDMII